MWPLDLVVITIRDHMNSHCNIRFTRPGCKRSLNYATTEPQAVSFLIGLCLHNSSQGKENRIWSSFIWNFYLFPSSGFVPENWGMAQTPSLCEFGEEPEGSHESDRTGCFCMYKSRTLIVYSEMVQ